MHITEITELYDINSFLFIFQAFEPITNQDKEEETTGQETNVPHIKKFVKATT